MSCYDELSGGFTQSCEHPIKSGIKKKGVCMNAEDIEEWIVAGSANQFLPVLKAGKIAFPIEVIGTQPFNGTNVASSVTDFSRDFTKTVVFNIPESGSAAALKVEQLTKSESGFVIMVEAKDTGVDGKGNFIIFGKDEPLLCSVAKDYVAGVSAPVITATSVERGYENFFFVTDYTNTKAAFDVLYAGDLTKRMYSLKNTIVVDDLVVEITRTFGSNSGATTYGLGVLTMDTSNPDGGNTILTATTIGDYYEFATNVKINSLAHIIHSVMVDTALEAAGTGIYFSNSTYSELFNIAGE
jgi:hypothetical protein